MRCADVIRCNPQRGFTLVELLVALSIMAILALMSWRGIDAMARAQTQTQERANSVLLLQTSLAQWGADLDAIAKLPPSSKPDGSQAVALDWNGLALRITRYASSGDQAGLRVVAWSKRDVQGQTMWLRWQSDVVRTQSDLQAVWKQAELWARSADDASKRQEVQTVALLDWNVLYFRNDGWSNALSSAESPTAMPDGVRLILTLPEGQALSGAITYDWMRPTLGGNKS